MMKKMHYYTELMFSPWPLISMMASLNMFFNFILFLKFYDKMMIMTIMMTSVTALCWWKDYSLEMNISGMNSNNMQNMIKSGMILFIVSEIMLFFSLFWAYFHFFLSPTMEISLSWPPLMTNMFNWLMMPMINTLILMLSSVTLTISHYNMFNSKNYKLFVTMLMSTIILGMMFTTLQMMEYKNSFFTMSDSNFGSIFFMLTGLHGLHVIIGSMFLMSTMIRTSNMNMSIENYISLDLSSWYWHFVDLVWILVYYSLYYLMN